MQSLVKRHEAFYQVSPYYVEVDERPVGRPATIRTVQAGFNVDVYGVRTEDLEPAMPPPEEYGTAYAELEQIADRVAQRATDSCSLEVIPFASTAIIDPRNHGKVEAMLRITISHFRGIEQPAGPAEKRALQEVEEELKSVGVERR
jgi:hypothetical protein